MKEAYNFEGLPNCFIIGASKSGTTTLYWSLQKHPGIYLSFVKEPNFFSNDLFYSKGLSWYQETFFPKASSFPVRLEGSTYYLYWSEKVAPRIARSFPNGDLKFLAIFRDPVQRAYSHYWHMVRVGGEKHDFMTALEKEEGRLIQNRDEFFRTGSMRYGYFWGGCYATQLRPFLKNFAQEQFLFLLLEDFKSDSDAAMQKVLNFLGLDSGIKPQQKVLNPAVIPRSLKIQQLIRQRSWIKEPFKRILPFRMRYAIKQKLLQVNLRRFQYPPIFHTLERQLRIRYTDEIHSLEEMIQRDLSSWLGNDNGG